MAAHALCHANGKAKTPDIRREKGAKRSTLPGPTLRSRPEGDR